MLYKAEREQIAPVQDNVWHTDIPAADVYIRGYVPSRAAKLFMDRYEELVNGKHRKAA